VVGAVLFPALSFPSGGFVANLMVPRGNCSTGGGATVDADKSQRCPINTFWNAGSISMLAWGVVDVVRSLSACGFRNENTSYTFQAFSSSSSW
jgi:hypothetical protein